MGKSYAKELNSANTVSEFWSGFFPSQACKWEHSPAYPCISFMWDHECYTHAWAPGPQKLWDNTCALRARLWVELAFSRARAAELPAGRNLSFGGGRGGGQEELDLRPVMAAMSEVATGDSASGCWGPWASSINPQNKHCPSKQITISKSIFHTHSQWTLTFTLHPKSKYIFPFTFFSHFG